MKKYARVVILFILILVVGYPSLVLFLGKTPLDPDLRDFDLRSAYLLRRVSEEETKDLFLKSSTLRDQEWLFGSYAMTAYAFTNIAMLHPERKEEARKNVELLIEKILSPSAKAFDQLSWGSDPLVSKTLASGEGHLAYYGQLNLVLGGYKLLGGTKKEYVDLGARLSDAIARRIQSKPFLQVETYPGEIYLADNTVAVASLRIADIVSGTGKYQKVISEWINSMKKYEDPQTGLLPFTVDSNSGKSDYSYRGLLVSWNSFFMPLIDESYAKILYQNGKNAFVFSVPGFSAVRETLTRAAPFEADQDSGPLIFGFGMSSTGFAVAGARHEGNSALLARLMRTIEAGGMTIMKGEERHYATLPIISDSIMLAMKTATPWRKL